METKSSTKYIAHNKSEVCITWMVWDYLKPSNRMVEGKKMKKTMTFAAAMAAVVVFGFTGNCAEVGEFEENTTIEIEASVEEAAPTEEQAAEEAAVETSDDNNYIVAEVETPAEIVEIEPVVEEVPVVEPQIEEAPVEEPAAEEVTDVEINEIPVENTVEIVNNNNEVVEAVEAEATMDSSTTTIVVVEDNKTNGTIESSNEDEFVPEETPEVVIPEQPEVVVPEQPEVVVPEETPEVVEISTPATTSYQVAQDAEEEEVVIVSAPNMSRHVATGDEFPITNVMVTLLSFVLLCGYAVVKKNAARA